MQEPSPGWLPTRLHFPPSPCEVLHRRLEIGYESKNHHSVAARRITVAGQETAEKAARAQRKELWSQTFWVPKQPHHFPCARGITQPLSLSVLTCDRETHHRLAGLPQIWRIQARNALRVDAQAKAASQIRPQPTHAPPGRAGQKPHDLQGPQTVEGPRPSAAPPLPRPAPLTSSRLRTTGTTRRQEARSS